MKKLLTTLSILLIATVAHTQELHHEEKFKISIPFGEEYDYKNIKVKRVIDGNTLLLENGERVRLIGIDTPESKPNDKAQRDSERTGQDIETINKMGQEATEIVKQLIKPGQMVQLEFDVQERDKYGRWLAYVWVGPWAHPVENSEKSNPSVVVTTSLLLNASIIKSGYATPMTIPPNVKYADMFKKSYEEAREYRRGLWKDGGDNLGVYQSNMNFNVVLTEVGSSEISVIKEVRAITNLGLKDAKDLVDSAPSVVKEGLNKKEAEVLKNKLEVVGAKVEIRGEGE